MIGDCDEQDTEILCGWFRQIVRSIIIFFDSLSVVALSRLFNMWEQEINVILRPLYSILRVLDSLNSSVHLLHPSFCDFLLNKQKCYDQHFWVDKKEVHRVLAESYLQLMSNLKRDICDLHALGVLTSKVDNSWVEQYLLADLQYVYRYWVQHFQQSRAHLCDNS